MSPCPEVAAGTGLVTVALAGSVDELVATDRSPDMLAILGARVASHRLSNVAVQEADALDLPSSDNAFDGALAANLLHIIPRPETAIQELMRVVRADGVICTPIFLHGHTALAEWCRVSFRWLAFLLKGGSEVPSCGGWWKGPIA